MEKICCIYCIECLANGKKYIGQTIGFYERKYDHLSRLRNNKHPNDCLQKAWNKYGKDNFKIYIVQKCNPDELDDLEIKYIDLYKTLSHQNGYNIESGGFSNRVLSQHTRDLISLHHADVSGENNPMYGVKMPKESIEKTVTHPNYINRKHKGEDSHLCTITEDIARKKKEYFADGHTLYRGEVKDIATKYNTSRSIVSHIKNGYTWSWL